jgi:hypothetical protein
LRAARSSKLFTAAAIVALVVAASLMVVEINSSPLGTPLLRNYARPADAPLPKDGLLEVRMLSNQNFSGVASDPLKEYLPVAHFPMAVATINSSIVAAVPAPLETDGDGFALLSLPPGSYLLQAKYQMLNIGILVKISSGNATQVLLNVSEAAYSLLYSEEADVGAQPSAYVELRSSAPVANVSEPVVLEVGNGATGGGYQVDAIVVSQQPLAQGLQWLKLVTAHAFDPVNATSILFATWKYSGVVQPPVPISQLSGFPPNGAPAAAAG